MFGRIFKGSDHWKDEPRDEKGRWTSDADSYQTDLQKQYRWLEGHAREKGFRDVQHMLNTSPSLFNTLARTWRRSHAMKLDSIFKYNEDQPRDDKGRWVAVTFSEGKQQYGVRRQVVTEGNNVNTVRTVSLDHPANAEEFTSRGAAEARAAELNQLFTPEKIKQHNLDQISRMAADIRNKRGTPAEQMARYNSGVIPNRNKYPSGPSYLPTKDHTEGVFNDSRKYKEWQRAGTWGKEGQVPRYRGVKFDQIFKFSPDQPRDALGRWAALGASGGISGGVKGHRDFSDQVKSLFGLVRNKTKSFLKDTAMAGIAEAGGDPREFRHLFKFENIFKVKGE